MEAVERWLLEIAPTNSFAVLLMTTPPSCEATTEKACNLIAEAAANGAELVAFPETYLPGYPYWIWLGTPTWGAPFFKELFKNSVEIESETTDALCAAAHAANTHVVMGINEREGGTLYNTLLYISREGEILGRHRKL